MFKVFRLSICFPGFLGTLFVIFSFPISLIAAGLPDTGKILCYDGSSMVACTEGNTGNNATYPGQDARFGRDAADTAGLLTKIGGGDAGFDYTKVCNSGELAGEGNCPANPSFGSSANEWGCTKDNITGLIWEVKTDDGGLRDKDLQYTWNSGYAAAVNQEGLCGSNSWRVPTLNELRSIVNFGKSDAKIDINYFPNYETPNIEYDGETHYLPYWTASQKTVGYSPTSWFIDFAFGADRYRRTSLEMALRLVQNSLNPNAGECTAGTSNLLFQQDTPTEDFIISSNQKTVIHKQTSLEWDRCQNGKVLDHNNTFGNYSDDRCINSSTGYIWPSSLVSAVSANNNTHLGLSGWRLPNIKELASITEKCGVNPAINTEIFPNATGEYFCSSSYLWGIRHSEGNTRKLTNTTGCNVRLVRGGNQIDSYDLLNNDADNDGMPDAWEVENNLNPINPDDASLDKDNDGLTNLQEFINNTDPADSDSDDDGVSDGQEISDGTDPNTCPVSICKSNAWKAIIPVILSANLNDIPPKQWSAGNGHYYQYMSNKVTWLQAKSMASSYVLNGMKGYLATITSAEENQFIRSMKVRAWIGGNDRASEGTWKWSNGPESGTVFWNGDASGSSPTYANWDSGQPNDFSTGEDNLNIDVTGKWKDNDDKMYLGYIIEYSSDYPAP